MWDLPGPGLEPVSPALADGFLTTVPPGKPETTGFICSFTISLYPMPINTASVEGLIPFPETKRLSFFSTLLILPSSLLTAAK